MEALDLLKPATWDQAGEHPAFRPPPDNTGWRPWRKQSQQLQRGKDGIGCGGQCAAIVAGHEPSEYGPAIFGQKHREPHDNGEDRQMAQHQPELPLGCDDSDVRHARVAQWNTLMRDTLPCMAKLQPWPVTQDHCFMRICLDTALGAPWHRIVKRPAIRHLSDQQLADAIAVAMRIVREPEILPALNAQSISWRNLAASGQMRATGCQDSTGHTSDT